MTHNIPLVITPAILQDRSLNFSLFLSGQKYTKHITDVLNGILFT